MSQTEQTDNYEAQFQRLVQVVESLERDSLGIEESLSLFEEGMRLAKACDHQLQSVEERIQVLVAEGGSGALATRGELPLDPVEVQNLENRGE